MLKQLFFAVGLLTFINIPIAASSSQKFGEDHGYMGRQETVQRDQHPQLSILTNEQTLRRTCGDRVVNYGRVIYDGYTYVASSALFYFAYQRLENPNNALLLASIGVLIIRKSSAAQYLIRRLHSFQQEHQE